ncbi:VOC family protein [Sphingomonas sp. IC081]|uniref:VOC family protein n=1 Tax=Sphingomonas sp. IC081 TaxID=304378 RepID=UPI001157ED30|nr:VOC family protein [Sphingomonas sp. IC081]QDK35696.1 glyoxalase [Sphingomonas sp. IC081]
MTICGIDCVTFGAADMEAARRFLSDWGLEDAGSTTDCLRFLTRDRTEVVVRAIDDPDLPSAMQDGPTLREVVWGVADEDELTALSIRLGGLASIVDPNGLVHGFRVTRRVPVQADPQDVNGPGVVRRVDARSPIYDRARPISIGHIVLFVDDLEAMLAFFTDRLGFTVSDSYPGHAAFLRARTPGPHHDAFILRRPGNPGLNHVAFTVSNIHEVFGGGLAMSRRGWETDIGPGRHPISSAYFWYFKSPFGGSLEYYADDDWCTNAWEPREFERKPELFAEWAIAGGIDGNTRRQARAA